LQKPTWFLFIEDRESQKIGIGEGSLLPGLSRDNQANFEAKLDEVCHAIEHYQHDYQHALTDFPALQFALETAWLDLQANNGVLFPSAFTEGKQAIPINGLIWMGDKQTMQQQIEDKLAQGFRCLKLKIGALDFAEEYALLSALRQRYSAKELEIRVDANGAFSPTDSLEKLQRLADLTLHSIEQPIAVGQLEAMAKLVEKSPLPIALDEELIPITAEQQKIALLDQVNPAYLILKPSLLGGFQPAQQWIKLAEQRKIGWWVTSALESNLGLNAIAQWTATLHNPLAQGLGTGLLYRNNLPTALAIRNAQLHFDPAIEFSKQTQAFFKNV
jgi:o-succinylbenzoate synthase